MIENAIVREWMSSPLITVSPLVSISNAHQIMKENGVRRLPVIENQRLVGVITIGDVREASPSAATSLSIWEMNYLWSQLTVAMVMTTQVITVSPDDTIIEAARMMLDHKVSGLPVVESGNSKSIVGILTESDVFRMLVKSQTELPLASLP